MIRFASILFFASVLIGCESSTSSDNGNTIVIPVQTTVQATVNLGTAANYAILAGSQISNVPPSTITGAIGISPAASSLITGFSLSYTTGNSFATSSQITGN